MQPRTLANFDRMAAIIDEHYPFNIVIVLHVSPAPELKIVREALAAMQQRHLYLRSRIEKKSSHRFVFDVTNPVPLEEIQVGDLSVWPVYAETQLNTHQDTAGGPLMRCLLLVGQFRKQAAVIFSFQHAILDGQAAVTFLKDFLILVGGGADEPLPPAPVIPEIRTLLPAQLRGLRGVPAFLSFFLRTAWDEITYRLHNLRQGEAPLQPAGACRILSMELTEEETHRFVQATRHSGVTINSLVNAALAVATCRVLYPGRKRRVRMITFADLRPYLNPPVRSEALGSAITMIPFTDTLPAGDSSWEFAERVQESLVKAFRRGDKFFTFLLSDRLIEMVLRWKKIRLGMSAMSYSGPVDLPLHSGAFELLGLNGFISNNRFGPVFAGQARIFRERLCLDLLYLDSDMDEKKAMEIRSALREELVDVGS